MRVCAVPVCTGRGVSSAQTLWRGWWGVRVETLCSQACPEDGGAWGQVGKVGLSAQALETWVLRAGSLSSAGCPQARVPWGGGVLVQWLFWGWGLHSCPSDLDKRVCS